MKINLLIETKDDIRGNGLSTDDIVFIGLASLTHSCTWNEFTVLADRYYDDGFGYQEVECQLIIMFKSGHRMYRHEYDGSEGWVLTKPFVMPESTLPLINLFYD